MQSNTQYPHSNYKPRTQVNRDIVEELKAHPELSYKEIGAKFGKSEYLIGSLALRSGLKHGRFGRRHGISSGRPLDLKNPGRQRVPTARTLREKQDRKIIAYVQLHPEMTYAQVAEAFGIAKTIVGNLMYKSGIRRTRVTPEAVAENLKTVEFIKAHPNLSYSDMSREIRVPTRYIAHLAREAGIFRGKGGGPTNNLGRAHTIRTRATISRKNLAHREEFQKQMLDVWDRAGDKHRVKLGRILKGRWTDEARQAMSRVMRAMWRAAEA
jgi:hypothetical protein